MVWLAVVQALRKHLNSGSSGLHKKPETPQLVNFQGPSGLHKKPETPQLVNFQGPSGL